MLQELCDAHYPCSSYSSAMFHLHLLDIGLQLLDFKKIIKDIEDKNWVDIEYAYYEYLCSLLKKT